MLPILIALIVFCTDCIVAFFVFNALVRRGNPMALPIAGFIILGGIVSAVFIWMNVPADIAGG
ncbi:MAG: hypothetical protein KDN19_20955 [Verrucomicrobiae bacterium]|nr:hypothetical protein [Verrucomicrobiae bacterium]